MIFSRSSSSYQFARFRSIALTHPLELGCHCDGGRKHSVRASVLLLPDRGFEYSLEVVHLCLVLYVLILDLITVGFILQVAFRPDEDNWLTMFHGSYFIHKALDRSKHVAPIGCAADDE